ncbi:RelA/SpoT domain protein [Lachnoclostridium phytofermentans ISDg]|uniref:RelA/SpoT domain protein n=1 Tax=Lachnoclostridium phytofermentans (strain ATCC 700394 / DSM 18823 / ISDg) TaxID=357809 RepID=A9KQA2_LACP7|nr:GTP pyrophosphokinase family protein [Lachnoclostridium phytofermentans]ABX40411.1 RelA/SpoT domain protein [Lachnoclostridium phytofermentans ISDg]
MELPMFYDQTEEWNRALLIYDAALKEVNTKLEILNNEFKLAHQYNPIEHITSRVKTPQSIAKKIRHNNMELTVENIVKYINDVAGIRIICSFTSDIYRIADLIRKQSDVKVLKIKDYITNPKPNGYMSYHMIVTVPIFLSQEVIETKVEIQIRTIAMDFWASLEHKMYYKFEGNAPSHITRELKECADIVSFLDQKMLAINEEIRTYSDDPMDHYREIVSGMFHSKIKDSYGSIVEDNISEEEVVKESVSENVKAIEQKEELIIDNEAEANVYSEMVSALQEKALKTKTSDKVPFSLFGGSKRKKQEMKANAQ